MDLSPDGYINHMRETADDVNNEMYKLFSGYHIAPVNNRI